jgi:hypothetical protein
LVRDHNTRSPGTPPEPTSNIAGNQGLIDCRRAVEGEPRDLHVVEAKRLGMFLDELLMLHHIELEIAHRKLASEADLGRSGR